MLLGVSPVDEIEIDRSSTDIVNLQLPTSTSSQNTAKRMKTMEEDEILTLRAEREKYIQEAEFYRVKTLYVKLKIQQMKTRTDSEFWNAGSPFGQNYKIWDTEMYDKVR